MSEMVNHPKHYNRGKIEVIEFLEDQFMGRPHEWNAVKYLSRADLKNADKEIEDLEKSIWYIKRKIELLKAAREGKTPIRPNDMNPQSTSVIDASRSKAQGFPPGYAKSAHAIRMSGAWGKGSGNIVCFFPDVDMSRLENQSGWVEFEATERS